MFKAIISTLTLFIISIGFALSQERKPEEFGFRYFQINYEGEQVNILISSKKGEENILKPLFLFCEGSLPQPLIKLHETGSYPVFPFNTDSLELGYHLVIIGKPFIPIVVDSKVLTNNFCYIDETGVTPKSYMNRNYLDYYVERNKFVLDFLAKKSWVSNKKLIVAGHSQGSTVAAKLALEYKQISHLIYSGGSPMGRVMRFIEYARMTETDTLPQAEKTFQYWESVVNDEDNLNSKNGGDSPKTTFDFSFPSIHYLLALNIPIMVSYGTKDQSSIFNDYLRIETIRLKKDNFTFKDYINTEHNYFPLKEDGSINYEIYNWDKVALDWFRWLKLNQ